MVKSKEAQHNQREQHSMGCGDSFRRANGKGEWKSRAFYRDLLSEFVATFMLMSVQSALPLSWDKGLGTAVQVGVGMGFIVCTMAWSLGDFGGGHMNPAVTISMLFAFKISVLRAICYICCQCVGAIAGAYFIAAVTPLEKEENLGATTLGEGVESWQGFLVEAWITCILVFTIFGATNSRTKNGNLFMPTIPIGFAVALGIMSGFGATGGSMNPARSLGPAVVKNIWADHWVYWAGPIVGGLVATFFYQVIFDRVGREEESEEVAQPSELKSYDNMASSL